MVPALLFAVVGRLTNLFLFISRRSRTWEGVVFATTTP